MLRAFDFRYQEYASLNFAEDLMLGSRLKSVGAHQNDLLHRTSLEDAGNELKAFIWASFVPFCADDFKQIAWILLCKIFVVYNQQGYMAGLTRTALGPS